MKCDRCENEATVHEVRIEAGKRREKHLCEECARAEGVAAPQMAAPITQLLSTFMLQQGEAGQVSSAAAVPGAAAPCPSCGTTYAQFRQSGLLGCSTCYAQFENQLVPLLSRAHEGGTHHTGKSPKHRSDAPPRVLASAPDPALATPGTPTAAPKVDPQIVAKALLLRIALLKKKLAEAIASEQYESAAKIRDELARLEGPKPAAPGPSPTPAPKRKPRSPGERPPPTPPTGESRGPEGVQ